MKTTVDLPDDLYRQAKAAAARRGSTLKELIQEGLRLAIQRSRRPPPRRSLAALMKRARGIIDSGIPDLASNPKHLTGLGRSTRDR